MAFFCLNLKLANGLSFPPLLKGSCQRILIQHRFSSTTILTHENIELFHKNNHSNKRKDSKLFQFQELSIFHNFSIIFSSPSMFLKIIKKKLYKSFSKVTCPFSCKMKQTLSTPYTFQFKTVCTAFVEF